mmetsp:Transcript_37145/g.79207  ORF Transcript_37145/g.79207 Transcript_37145/m.79207 type:complete len:96 (-) Transcript_37145:955-1242(-)
MFESSGAGVGGVAGKGGVKGVKGRKGRKAAEESFRGYSDEEEGEAEDSFIAHSDDGDEGLPINEGEGETAHEEDAGPNEPVIREDNVEGKLLDNY